ncbi:MAG TPA: TatD family hydrolase [Candidatus Dormibacteraeota bacterium]|jgi:TatD DNase family protein|nr:TatD family hydrolase [Candidatus Dormibacteraeota bacterium]
MRLVDTHAHLEELPDLERDLAEARAAGVTDVIGMGVDGPTSRQVVAWAASLPGVWAAVGHHPLNQEGPDLELLRRLASHPRVVAIGEVGLDHEDEHRGPHQAQLEWFHACCRLAVELGLPVCVHVRGSVGEVYEALRDHPGITGVMHYWTLDWAWARRFLDLGMYLGFSGVLTRAGRHELREVARRVPAHRLLVETDAPWGTPRGRKGPMRPAWVLDTVAALAEIRGMEVAELAELERANACRLFPGLGG